MKIRERWPDFLRASALLVIIAYHVGFASGQSSFSTVVSYLPRMGMLFALGGMFIVGAMDRDWEKAISQRLKRLLVPVWALALIVVPVMLFHGWHATLPEATPIHSYEYKLFFWFVPMIVPPASNMGIWWAITLWFMVTYLWLIVLTPVLLPAFRRWPIPTLLTPLLLTFLWEYTPIDERFGQFAYPLRYVCAYASCWIIGFACREGMLRKFPVWKVVCFATFFMASGVIWLLTHKVAGRSVDLKSNLVAESLYAIGSAALLLRFSPALKWTYHSIIRRPLALINQRAMTIYIWHQICISIIVAQFLWRIDSPLPNGITLYFLVLALLMIPILVLGPLEDLAARRKPVIFPGKQEKKPKPKVVYVRRRPQTKEVHDVA